MIIKTFVLDKGLESSTTSSDCDPGHRITLRESEIEVRGRDDAYLRLLSGQLTVHLSSAS